MPDRLTGPGSADAPGRPDAALLMPAEQRRNVLVLGADMVLFMAAVGWIGPLTFVPLFVSKLTANPLALGGLMAVFQLGSLPQLIAAGYLERTPSPRRWLILFSGLERLPALGLTACAALATSLSAPVVVALVYLCRFSQSLLGGPAGTSWIEMVARTVPANRRGNFMGASTMIGDLLGALAAALSAPLLDLLGFPGGFVACFGLGFVLLVAGFLPLFWFVEPPGHAPRPPRPLRSQLADLGLVLRTDRPFRRFLSGLSWQAFGMMGNSFLVVYAVQRLAAPDDLVAWYTVVLLAGQMLANLAFDRLADRHGFSAVGQASSYALAGLAAVALLVPTAGWLVPAFFLLGACQSGSMLARFAGAMDFAPADRRPSYVVLASALVSLSAAAAPLFGGQVVALFGYPWLFALSLACALVAAVALGSAPRPLRDHAT